MAVPPARHRPVGAALFGVCRTCHGPSRPGSGICWSCREIQLLLREKAPKVVPVFLHTQPSAAYRYLVAYKGAVSMSSREHAADLLARLFGQWLAAHLRCLVGFPPASRQVLLVPVPSSSGGRPSWEGRHPLVALAERAARELKGAVASAPLLEASPHPPQRLRPHADGFVMSRDVMGEAVVVLDDIWTSGARAMSAASALRKAGAEVRAIVPIGRQVRPDHNEHAAAFWAELGRVGADLSICASSPSCRKAPAGERVLARSRASAVERLAA